MFTNGCVLMSSLEDTILRALAISKRIRLRSDKQVESLIRNFPSQLEFEPLDNFMISHQAWDSLMNAEILPQIVFAHPEILSQYPETSQHYRGIALIPQKRMTALATSVTSWENGERKKPPSKQHCLNVARVYNTVISSIIENSDNWTIDNGYRNIMVNMGSQLEGYIRNTIGRNAEKLIKDKILDWLIPNEIVNSRADTPSGTYELQEGTLMIFGTEPDIAFLRQGATVAAVEIKAGKDPSAALERLGAMTKSFAENPPRLREFFGSRCYYERDAS